MSEDPLVFVVESNNFEMYATVIGAVFAGLSALCVYLLKSRCTHIRVCCIECDRIPQRASVQNSNDESRDVTNQV